MTVQRAFVFPGQGSQHIGMGKDFYETYDSAKTIFEQGNEILGTRITDIMFCGTEEQLRATEVTQPALYLTSLAICAVLEEKGYVPSVVAGHSLGEYTALTVAGVLDIPTGIRLVMERGTFLKQAAEEHLGGMLAILGFDAQKVSALAEQYTTQFNTFVAVANYNTPIQTVVSFAGDKAMADALAAAFTKDGAKRAIPLNVSGPFHCALMDSASEKMAATLAQVKLNEPRIPMVFNVNGNVLTNSSEIKDAMIKQVNHSVQWIDVMNTIAAHTTTVLEVGPGKVLTGLNKKINAAFVTGNVEKVEDIEGGI